MKIVLAYSGGLDTSVIIKWLKDKYNADVIAASVDLGEGKDLEFIREKALKIGASKSYIIDGKDMFVNNYIYPALQANAMYEGKYPLATALARPLITKLLVDIAQKEGASAIAHGCTGKGNDQVRFDVCTMALAPDMKVIAPVREWPMSREDEIKYAEDNGIPVPVTVNSPYSIDQNLWGRSIECGVLENPWNIAPDDAFEWTVAPENAPDEPVFIDINFENGIPVGLNGQKINGVELIHYLNKLAGSHGVGRIDHIENRLVGIKSRETYEAPAAYILVKAHQDLEQLTMTKDTLQFKWAVEKEYANIVYNGLWYSPLKGAIDAFISKTQECVNGTVKIKLYKGNSTVVARKSSCSLYDEGLSTYDKADKFDHSAAEGFIKLWGLPLKINALVNGVEGEKKKETSKTA